MSILYLLKSRTYPLKDIENALQCCHCKSNSYITEYPQHQRDGEGRQHIYGCGCQIFGKFVISMVISWSLFRITKSVDEETSVMGLCIEKCLQWYTISLKSVKRFLGENMIFIDLCFDGVKCQINYISLFYIYLAKYNYKSFIFHLKDSWIAIKWNFYF